MSRYIRPKVPGACVFFTVNLVDRGADTLVRHVGLLRQAVVVTRAKRPFGIDAWVVLPDHMHCVWTLPEGDSDYSNRMSEIKGRFTRELRRSGSAPTPTGENAHGVRGGRVRVGAGPEERVGAGPDLHFLNRSETELMPKTAYNHATFLEGYMLFPKFLNCINIFRPALNPIELRVTSRIRPICYRN
jgi:putative transposase